MPSRDNPRPNYPEEVFGLLCDECGGFMKLKRSHVYNSLFYGCETWPACNNAFSASKTGRPLPGQDNRPQPTESKPELLESYPCACGGDQTLLWSHRRQAWFYGCSNYPKCNINHPLPRVDRWYLLTRPEKEEEKPLKLLPSKEQKRASKRFKVLLDDDF